jgi:hypothetical protein
MFIVVFTAYISVLVLGDVDKVLYQSDVCSCFPDYCHLLMNTSVDKLHLYASPFSSLGLGGHHHTSFSSTIDIQESIQSA